jgi:hypothetical protein
MPEIQIEVSWVVMSLGVVTGYQYFGGSCCLHLQGENPLKHWYFTTTLHGITAQKTPV